MPTPSTQSDHSSIAISKLSAVIMVAVLFGLSLPAQAQNDWIPVNPERAGASVRLPSRPRVYAKTFKPVVDQDPIRIHFFQSTDPEGSATFLFTYHDEHEAPRNRVQIKKFLDGAVKGGVGRVLGKLENSKEIMFSKHRGRDFVYTCTQSIPETTHLKIRTRVLMVGARVYQLNYMSKAEDFNTNVATEFFETFQFEKTPKDLPPLPRPGRAKPTIKPTVKP